MSDGPSPTARHSPGSDAQLGLQLGDDLALAPLGDVGAGLAGGHAILEKESRWPQTAVQAQFRPYLLGVEQQAGADTAMCTPARFRPRTVSLAPGR